jgi:hypothetical protein
MLVPSLPLAECLFHFLLLGSDLLQSFSASLQERDGKSVRGRITGYRKSAATVLGRRIEQADL